MKKRRALLLSLLILLLLVGIPVGFLLREYRQERLNRDLIEAIVTNDTPSVLTALNAGASPNAPLLPPDKRPILRRWFARIFQREPPLRLDQTVFLVAVEGVRGRNTAPPENGAILKAMLDHGANINVQDEAGYTVLIIAAASDHAETVKLLLDRGANTAIKSYYTSLAVWDTATNSYIPIGERSALQIAMEFDHPNNMKLLLDHGDNVNVRDDDGQTLLSKAITHHKDECVRLLKQYGAKTAKDLDAQAATPPKR